MKDRIHTSSCTPGTPLQARGARRHSQGARPGGEAVAERGWRAGRGEGLDVHPAGMRLAKQTSRQAQRRKQQPKLQHSLSCSCQPADTREPLGCQTVVCVTSQTALKETSNEFPLAQHGL